MKRIKSDELYANLTEFLKTKGVEFTDGSYTRSIQRGCSFLTDAINRANRAVEQTRAELKDKMDRLRQKIHEKTAPPPPKTTGRSKAAKPQAKTASSPGRPGRAKAGKKGEKASRRRR
jgi:hypothetical protein